MTITFGERATLIFLCGGPMLMSGKICKFDLLEISEGWNCFKSTTKKHIKMIFQKLRLCDYNLYHQIICRSLPKKVLSEKAVEWEMCHFSCRNFWRWHSYKINTQRVLPRFSHQNLHCKYRRLDPTPHSSMHLAHTQRPSFTITSKFSSTKTR